MSPNDSSSLRILVLNNLTLDIDHDNLKNIIQDLTHTTISKLRVRNLPTGISTANVWLSDQSSEELERVQKFFQGSRFDGNPIQVLINSDPSVILNY